MSNPLNKHTPGPWVTGKNYATRSTDNIYSSKAAEPGEAIARCYGWVGREQQAANATLVAAAPDMLDVLEGVQLQLSTYFWTGGKDDKAGLLKSALAKVGEVIKKAKEG